MWDEITYPLPNCNGCTVSFSEWKNNITQNFIVIDVSNYPYWDFDYIIKKGPLVLRPTSCRRLANRGFDSAIPLLSPHFRFVGEIHPPAKKFFCPHPGRKGKFVHIFQNVWTDEDDRSIMKICEIRIYALPGQPCQLGDEYMFILIPIITQHPVGG